MEDKPEEGQLLLGNGIQLSFADDKSLIALKDIKAEEQIHSLFQEVD